MEVAEAVPQWNYREKVLWEYVLQPVNKATYQYWDQETLPTEERRVISRRALKVAELNEEWVTKEVYIGDVLIDKTIMKAKLPREPPFAKIINK